MDTLACLLLLLPLACLDSASAEYGLGVTLPESPVVEIGKNLTAMCVLHRAARSTADSIYWLSNNISIPKEQYTKINDSAVNVTISITSETPRWLFCMSKRSTIHGISVKKGYPPEKPKNLSCMAVQLSSQSGSQVSSINCTWEPGTTEHKELIPVYTLFVSLTDTSEVHNNTSRRSSGLVKMQTYPFHMMLSISVEVENDLGKVRSDTLEIEADDLVKTFPPSAVKLISEKEFSKSLRVEWVHPIGNSYLKLKYNIRFCMAASGGWIEVPQSETPNYMESFRLQDLKPDTEYVVQVRCIKQRGGGYWSNWSLNATARTPEAKPTSTPDLWRVIIEGKTERSLQVISKAPVESNGKIREYGIKFQDRDWETVTVNNTDLDSGSQERKVTVGNFVLSEKKTAYVQVTARNAVGESPKASLFIPKISLDLPRVRSLEGCSREGKLWLKWEPAPSYEISPPQHKVINVSEYVVEWVSLSDGQMDWQREGRHCTQAFIRGKVEKFKQYSISVYPMFNGMIGKPSTIEAYLEEGDPLEGVSLKLVRAGKHDAELEWAEIPLDKRRGFIENYTIYYSTLGKTHAIHLNPHISSYTLTSLPSHSSVVVRVAASTIRGETNSTELTFITHKYAPGQVEGVVMAVCFGFLFFVVLTMFFCIYKKNWIKRIIWPDVPDPSNSTIATWSPDFPSKPDTPKESALADVSVVEVDVFDGKSLFEEDKACLPLKKDKYLSEEHSSGIGGSSCMSSPRQSVSDSDEGGDSGQTTASTVQYSSVVASSGYKGQTPGPLPQNQTQTQPSFARSESTQPLLDSEEHPDVPGQEGSGQAQRYPRNPYFRRSPGGKDHSGCREAEFNQMEMEDQGGFTLLRFSPLEEGSQQTTPTEEEQSPDGQPARPASSYRPQLSGYRPQ